MDTDEPGAIKDVGVGMPVGEEIEGLFSEEHGDIFGDALGKKLGEELSDSFGEKLM